MQWMVKVVYRYWQSVQVLLMSILGKLFKFGFLSFIVTIQSNCVIYLIRPSYVHGLGEKVTYFPLGEIPF
jgi:hypothetical protein